MATAMGLIPCTSDESPMVILYIVLTEMALRPILNKQKDKDSSDFIHAILDWLRPKGTAWKEERMVLKFVKVCGFGILALI